MRSLLILSSLQWTIRAQRSNLLRIAFGHPGMSSRWSYPPSTRPRLIETKLQYENALCCEETYIQVNLLCECMMGLM
jgi:hypothetical protein